MNSLVTPSARISLKAAALAIFVALGVILVPAGSAHADDGDAAWTVRTASNSLGSERTSYSYTLSPGGTVTDAVVIANNGTTAVDLGVYAADGYTTKSGQFDLVVGGAKSANIGAWTASDSDGATIAPGESKEIPFTLTVPKTATPGDYAGGIVTSLVNAEQQDGINVDRRLGIRIALRVSGDLKPSLAVEDSHLNWGGGLNPFAGGDATFSYTIHNTGNTLLSAQQTASVTGPFGWLKTDAGTIKPTPRLLPGERWKVTIPVADVPAAIWLAASAAVTPIAVDASGSTSALTPVVASANGWAIPWMLLVLLVVLAALVVAGILVAKRLRIRSRSREDERVKEAVERALGEKDTATA